MKIFRSIIFLWAVLLAGHCAAQEKETPSEGTAYLRCFADLGTRGDAGSYSLSLSGPKTKEGRVSRELFTRLNGGFTSNSGHGAIPLPAGPYEFRLVQDNGGSSKNITGELEADAMYSLLATKSDGPMTLRLVKEYPLADGAPQGVIVHHLLGKTPLMLRVGDNLPSLVPSNAATSHLIPASQFHSAPVSLSYASERKTERTRQLSYEGTGRLITVFMRNGYGQTTLLELPSKPEIVTSMTMSNPETYKNP